MAPGKGPEPAASCPPASLVAAVSGGTASLRRAGRVGCRLGGRGGMFTGLCAWGT